MVSYQFRGGLAALVWIGATTIGMAKSPNCTNALSTNLVSQQLSKYMIDSGVPDTTPAELATVFEIANIQMIGHKEQQDTYSCEADYIVHYPKDLSTLILNSYSTAAGQLELQANLAKKFGKVQAAVDFNKMQSIFMTALSAAKQQSTGKSLKQDELSQAIKSTLSDTLDQPNPGTIRYTIFPIKQINGGPAYDIKWDVDDDGSIDIPLFFFKINAAYR